MKIFLSLILKYQQRLKRAQACRKLDRIVRANRDSYECRRFREHRAAALKGRQGRARACQSH